MILNRENVSYKNHRTSVQDRVGHGFRNQSDGNDPSEPGHLGFRLSFVIVRFIATRSLIGRSSLPEPLVVIPLVVFGRREPEELCTRTTNHRDMNFNNNGRPQDVSCAQSVVAQCIIENRYCKCTGETGGVRGFHVLSTYKRWSG